MNTSTSRTNLIETMQAQMNEMNRVHGHSQITKANDPRIALADRINATMDAMTPDEQNYLLDKWNH